VIRSTATSGGTVLEADAPPEIMLYVDADWIPGGQSGDVPALAATGRSLAWADGEQVEIPVGSELDDIAAQVLVALAQRAADVVLAERATSVDVVGAGAVATCVRSLLTLPTSPTPSAVVDASGDPELIADATRRVADLGVVVLVGEPAGRALAVDFYPDVHVRGLRLVGVARPDLADVSRRKRVRLPEVLARGPTRAELGSTLPAGLWYRLST
jgi:hypothetical protein